MQKYLTFFIVSFYLLVGCQNVQEAPVQDPGEFKDPLVGANKILVQRENEYIDSYARRHGWDMTKTGTGLRILIYHRGEGPKVESGSVVRAEYAVNLLNGLEVYNSYDDGPLTFVTGRAEVINGLEEAILMMHKGDKAKVIIPSYLAYGLLGDDEKIPKRATLVYDIELTDIMKPQ